LLAALFVVAELAAGEAIVFAVPAFAFDAAAFVFVAAGFGFVNSTVVPALVFAPITFSVDTAEFAFAFALASVTTAGDSAGIAPDSKTDRPPVNAWLLSKKAESINVVAAAIVIFDKILSVPRGPKAVLETLLVNSAPASDFPGCKSTDAISVMQDKMNSV
jgi:hypothetical protein